MGKVWTKQPPVGTPLRKDGLAAGLRTLCVFDPVRQAYFDVVSGTYSTGMHSEHSAFYDNTISGWVVRKEGVTSTISNLLLDYTKLRNDWTDAVSVMALTRDLGDYTSRPLLQSSGGGEDFLLGFEIGANESPAGRIGSGVDNISSAAPVLPDNVWSCFGITRATGFGQQAFGQLGGGAVSTTTTAAPNKPLHNFNIQHNGNGDPSDLSVWGIWNRQLGTADAKAWLANPWQIFERKPKFALTDMPADVRLLIAPKVRTKQPPVGTPIDWANPLTQGLIHLDKFDTSAFLDETGNALPETAPVALQEHTYSRNKDGTGREFITGTEARRGELLVDGPYVFNAEMTAACIFRLRLPATTASHYLYGCERSGFSSWRLTANGAINTYGFGIWGDVDTANVNAEYTPASFDTDHRPHTIVGRFKRNAIHDIWVDGNFGGSATPKDDVTRSGTLPIQTGGEWLNDLPNDEEVYLTAFWNRTLSDAETKSFSDNPWQIFKPESIYATYPYVPAELGGPDGRDRLFTFKRPWK